MFCVRQCLGLSVHQASAASAAGAEPSVNYGVYAVAQDKLGENDIFDENGNVADGVVDAKVEKNAYVSFEFKIVGFNDDTKDGGEIGAGHCVVALYEVVPAGSGSSQLRYQEEEEQTKQESKYADEYCAISIRYKEPDGNESKLLTYPVNLKVESATPSDDFLFAAYVAETGMILKDSDYVEKMKLTDVYEDLKDLQIQDENRKEFVQLLEELIK